VIRPFAVYICVESYQCGHAVWNRMDQRGFWTRLQASNWAKSGLIPRGGMILQATALDDGKIPDEWKKGRRSRDFLGMVCVGPAR
jgi:hypothetical protein